MIHYKRHIEKKLLSIRLLLPVLAITIFAAFKFHHDNAGYFCSVTLLFLSLVVVNNVVVLADTFTVSKYYCFGLYKKSWSYTRGDNINFSSIGPYFGEPADLSDIDHTGSGLGCLFAIVAPLLPGKTQSVTFIIERRTATDQPFNRVLISLNRTEFDYLETFAA